METLTASAVADLPPRTPQAWSFRRQVGSNGVRFSAVLEEERLGYLEVDIAENGSRFDRPGRADIATSRARGNTGGVESAPRCWPRRPGGGG